MKKIILPLLGVLLLASCNDDFMERIPENSISDGAVWKTPADLELYVNNFYNRDDLLPRYAGSGNIGLYTADRDNGSDTQIPQTYNQRMNGQATIPATAGWVSGDFDELRDINYFFANYGKATGDEAAIKRTVGEALFFRSIVYYNKLRSFGDMPWYDHLLAPNDEALYKPRDSRSVVAENMLNDLATAAEYLPLRGVEASWNGRVNKETAMMLAARIALYEGTWEKYHAGTDFGVTGSDGTKFLTKAKEITDALITLGTCDLDNIGAANGYADVFNKEGYKTSKEVLFWREYKLADGNGNWWSDYSTYGARTGLTKRMVDMYLMADGSPIEGNAAYKGDATLLDVVDGRDPRLSQTIFVNDNKHVQFSNNGMFTYPTLETGGDRGCITGYQLFKGHIPRVNLAGATGSQAMIYFRYAEALLINAEAKAELGTITQGDIDNTINKLRRRLVGMADMKLTDVNALPAGSKMFPALSNIINEVRRERTVELAAEGFRVDDIFRWAAADELIKGYVPQGAKLAQWQGVGDDAFKAAVAALSVDAEGYILPYAKQAFPTTGYNFNLGRDYLNPLPSNQLTLFTNLKQNPGW